jgi:FixJ family two-component response regulator
VWSIFVNGDESVRQRLGDPIHSLAGGARRFGSTHGIPRQLMASTSLCLVLAVCLAKAGGLDVRASHRQLRMLLATKSRLHVVQISALVTAARRNKRMAGALALGEMSVTYIVAPS